MLQNSDPCCVLRSSLPDDPDCRSELSHPVTSSQKLARQAREEPVVTIILWADEQGHWRATYLVEYP